MGRRSGSTISFSRAGEIPEEGEKYAKVTLFPDSQDAFVLVVVMTGGVDARQGGLRHAVHGTKDGSDVVVSSNEIGVSSQTLGVYVLTHAMHWDAKHVILPFSGSFLFLVCLLNDRDRPISGMCCDIICRHILEDFIFETFLCVLLHLVHTQGWSSRRQ